MTSAPVAAFADVLRQLRLLEPDQVVALARLQEQCTEPKALARELLQRGWLTAYQANQLLQGRGQDLVLGQYVLLERLGEGGMGAVFKARHQTLDRIVALKLIRKERLTNPEAIKRFRREIQAAAQLNHPHIVLAFDADEARGTHFFTMEYVEGIDLHKWIKKHGPMPIHQAGECIRQAALGLQHAHECGLVHRDIKPGNLLLEGARGQGSGSWPQKPVVKILDMGLARVNASAAAEEAASTLTQEGAVMGTPDFLAPEQARASHAVDIRADLYSLGCTFYLLLTGKVPFPGGSAFDKMFQHRMEEPVPVEKRRPEVPPALATVVRKLMAKDPADRFQTPAELASVLQGVEMLRGGEGANAPILALPQPAATPPPDSAANQHRQRREADRRRWRKINLAGGTLLLALAALMAFLLRPTGPRQAAPALAEPASTFPPDLHLVWIKHVAGLPAEEQVRAVTEMLKKRNPSFDGPVKSTIADGTVVGLEIVDNQIRDLSPLQALPQLRNLVCRGTSPNSGNLEDLAGLKGLALDSLNCSNTQVVDLKPLHGMPLRTLLLACTQVADLKPLENKVSLTTLSIFATKVTDLRPLRNLPLTTLNCSSTKIDDLSPLREMPLTTLECSNTAVSDLTPLLGMRLTRLEIGLTKVSDLTPLRGMDLDSLNCNSTPVSDLSPLKDMPLTTCYFGNTEVRDLSPLRGKKLVTLDCSLTKVTDLSALQDMPLRDLRGTFQPGRDTALLRSIKTLGRINGKLVADFWKEFNPQAPP